MRRRRTQRRGRSKETDSPLTTVKLIAECVVCPIKHSGQNYLCISVCMCACMDVCAVLVLGSWTQSFVCTKPRPPPLQTVYFRRNTHTQPGLREQRVCLPPRLEYIQADLRILLTMLLVLYLQLFYLHRQLELRYLFGMFYILVIAIAPHFLAPVFCWLVGPFCCSCAHVTCPSHDRTLYFGALHYLLCAQTTSAPGFLTDLLPEFWSWLFLQAAPFSALGQKYKNWDEGKGNLHSYKNTPT